jgi:hypothetical protein
MEIGSQKFNFKCCSSEQIGNALHNFFKHDEEKDKIRRKAKKNEQKNKVDDMNFSFDLPDGSEI